MDVVACVILIFVNNLTFKKKNLFLDPSYMYGHVRSHLFQNFWGKLTTVHRRANVRQRCLLI